MAKVKSQEWFLQKCKESHNVEYDYSKAIYLGRTKDVIVICKEHGEFIQNAGNHMNGYNCPTCGNISKYKKITKIIQIDELEKLFNKLYTDKGYVLLTKNDIRANLDKVEFLCPKHGNVKQKYKTLLRGSGCPKCAIPSRKFTKENFIEKAIEIHGNKYNYSKVNYVNIKSKVCIVCSIHGKFIQTAANHLQGKGCPKCNKRAPLGFDVFKNKANIKFSNKYTYDQLSYKNLITETKIICPEHGEFYQRPDVHLKSDYGCPICAEKAVQSINEGYLFERLKENFTVVHSQYNLDNRYPFYCDFYIPERDMFIEYNEWWMHGSQWCDLRTAVSNKLINSWNKKDGQQYKAALNVYCKRDRKKKKVAKINKLNYIVLWNKQDIEDWFSLGCPDGHDGDGMYTWKSK